jgi:hypothetical protein
MTGPVIAMKDLQVDVSGDVLDYLFFNQRFLIITNSINGLAARQDGYDETVNTLVQTGLDRINTVLGPFLTELQAASTLGFLVVEAWGGTPIQLTLNVDLQFNCTSAGIAVFTPTPYVLALDELDSSNWGILSTTSYNPANGQYAGHVVYCTKTQNSDKWSLSCNSALPAAMMDLLSQAQAAATSATSEAAQVQQLLTEVTQLIQIVQSGPVVSVCGKAGVVTLVPADITGLVGTLNGLATVTALNTGLSQKQNVSSLLNAFTSLPAAADKNMYFTGAGTMSVASYTAFARTIDAAADAPTVRSLLGLGDASTNPASDFLTPSSVAGLTINSTQIGPVFDDQTVTSFALGQSDFGKVVTFTNAAAIAVSLQASIVKGWNAMVCQGGAGVISFTGVSGVTLVNRQSQYKSAGQYAMMSLLCISNAAGNNPVIVLGGDTAP